MDGELPPALLSFIRLLTFPTSEWTNTRNKGKLPKGKIDDARILQIITAVLQERLREYATSIEVKDTFELRWPWLIQLM
jgi:N-lysine methyltransferase SETD6